MANTTNFGWETPDDTDLVKDGASAMRTLGNSIDTSMADLKGGTTGQILTKNSNTDMDFIWAAANPGDITAVTAGTGISGGGTSGDVTITNSMATAIDAKGDLIAGTGADTFSRLAVGTNNQILMADSTTATGLKWANASSTFAGCSLYTSTAQTINNSVTTIATYNAENFDTDGYHSTTTNTSRITIPSGKAGKYLLTASVAWTGGTAAGLRQFYFYKNGVEIGMINRFTVASGTTDIWQTGSQIVDAAVNDYFEVAVMQSGGSASSLDSGSTRNFFQCAYLGA